MEQGESFYEPRRRLLHLTRSIKRAIIGSAIRPEESEASSLEASSFHEGYDFDSIDSTVSEDEVIEIYNADKDRFDTIMLRLRDMAISPLEDEVPEGFIESYAVGIYPFTERYISLLALRSSGFDIRFMGPILSGTEMFDHDLHDELRTAVRPDEHEKIEKILFRSRGYAAIGWCTPSKEPDAYNALHVIGYPIIKGTQPFTPNKWHELLDTMRSNVYFNNGNIFRSNHFATRQSGIAPWYNELLEEGILPRIYMTSHIMHDLVYRNRETVPKVGEFDMKIYKFLKDKGFEPYGPEEIVGIAHTMIREILLEHPEWAPDPS
ncbi:MAG: hypothetical protein NVSMB46_03280 [Candidatus Saccharimonadales bacterium]